MEITKEYIDGESSDSEEGNVAEKEHIPPLRPSLMIYKKNHNKRFSSKLYSDDKNTRIL
jgi:hypothetical protein